MLGITVQAQHIGIIASSSGGGAPLPIIDSTFVMPGVNGYWIEEYQGDGSSQTDSSDLEFGEDGTYEQQLGLIFDAQIPKFAEIVEATIQFEKDESGHDPAPITDWYGYDTNNPALFVEGSAGAYYVRDFPRTTAKVTQQWGGVNADPIGNKGENQKSDDLSSIIQELVNRSDYTEERIALLAFHPIRLGARVFTTSITGDVTLSVKFRPRSYTNVKDTIVITNYKRSLEEDQITGEASANSSDIELGYDNPWEQEVGLIFDANIPAGAIIKSAYIQFTKNSNGVSGTATGTWSGLAEDTPALFNSDTYPPGLII